MQKQKKLLWSVLQDFLISHPLHVVTWLINICESVLLLVNLSYCLPIVFFHKEGMVLTFPVGFLPCMTSLIVRVRTLL